MAVFKRTYRDPVTGETKKTKTYSYDFEFAGRRYKGSTKCTGKTRAEKFLEDMRKRLERALAGVPTDKPESRILTVRTALCEYRDLYAKTHAPKSAPL